MAVIIQNSLNRNVKASVIRKAALATLKLEGAVGAEVSLLITDDEGIHGLNLQYRGQDKPTDVLSFSQRDAVPENDYKLLKRGKEILGDVVISLETAEKQAVIHDVTLDEELALLTVHGVLHLLGYDDATEQTMLEMQAKERILGVRE